MVLFQVIDKFSNDFAKSAFKLEKVRTDNVVFRLHYKFSVWLVVLYSVCYMYVAWSNPISCLGSIGRDVTKEVNDYCWVHGTYVVEGLKPHEEIFPGVGSISAMRGKPRYHHYYKWMYFYIFAMIILLHAPRQFWRNVEGGRMRALAFNLKSVVCHRTENHEREKDQLTEYIYCHLGYFRQYASCFVMAEIMNVAISGFLMYMWDHITDHEFSQHGIEVVGFQRTPHSQRTDRLTKVFPIMAKCLFKRYGPSGNIESHDYLCVLPLNLINEKAAVFFWYYFMSLTVIGCVAVLYRFTLIMCKSLRVNLLCGLSPLSAIENMAALNEKLTYGDWFVLHQLGCVIEPVMFREIMVKLYAKIRQRN